MKKICIFLIDVYKKTLSPIIGNSCRFTPTCSEYMILAIQKYGLVLGVIKGIRRLLRCHQPNGGIDNP